MLAKFLTTELSFIKHLLLNQRKIVQLILQSKVSTPFPVKD